MWGFVGKVKKESRILSHYFTGLVLVLVLNRWACGVILFTLLAGSPPFWHRKQMLMLRMIMEGRYQFSSPEWDDRSDTVKDLVRRIKL